MKKPHHPKRNAAVGKRTASAAAPRHLPAQRGQKTFARGKRGASPAPGHGAPKGFPLSPSARKRAGARGHPRPYRSSPRTERPGRKPIRPHAARRSRPRPRRPARPRQVYLAIRKLLDATNHIQARAAQVETALETLRDHERARALTDLLLALRNSPEGDLLRPDPAAPDDAASNTAHAITAALVEAFAITPIRTLGERIPLRDGRVPDTLDLDRPLAGEPEQCIAAEVLSVGWSYKHHTLLKPVVRPIFTADPPSGPPEAEVTA